MKSIISDSIQPPSSVSGLSINSSGKPVTIGTSGTNANTTINGTLEVTGAVTLGSDSGDIILGNSSSTINIGTSGGTITIGNEDKKNATLYGSATNIQNGAIGNLLYQSATGTTAFVPSSTSTTSYVKASGKYIAGITYYSDTNGTIANLTESSNVSSYYIKTSGDILTYDATDNMPIWTTPQALIFKDSANTFSSSYDTSTSALNITIGEGLTGKKTDSKDKDFTLAVTAATDSTLGGIKIGYSESGKNYPVKLDDNKNAYVNVPWTDTDTTYSVFSSSANGLVPAPTTATATTSYVLTGNGAWTQSSAAYTVFFVDMGLYTTTGTITTQILPNMSISVLNTTKSLYYSIALSTSNKYTAANGTKYKFTGYSITANNTNTLGYLSAAWSNFIGNNSDTDKYAGCSNVVYTCWTEVT